jgi:hypothetical protein
MNNDSTNLSRIEKILLFLYEYGNGRAKIRYEDIVAGLFKKYPHDFHLKGYVEYPDSGDLIHKPLYDFKKKGYVNAVSKVFSLTDRGVEFAKQLSDKGDGKVQESKDRLSRSASTEIDRIKSLEGYALFIAGNGDRFSDNDFYNYLGVTVRTQKNAFVGRLETINAVMEEIAKYKEDSLYSNILAYHKFLMGRSQSIIEFFSKN